MSLKNTPVFLKDENSLEYKNWWRLLTSGDPDNIALAITLIKGADRPPPKFFSLWFFLGLYAEDGLVQETAESFLLEYFEKEYWEALRLSKISSLKKYISDVDNPASHFFDINYLYYWEEHILPKRTDAEFGFLFVSSKNTEILSQSKYFKKNLSKVVQINFRLEEGDDLKFLFYLLKRKPALKELNVVATKAYPLSIQILRLLNRQYLFLKNFVFPDVGNSRIRLRKVENLEWVYAEEIYFTDQIFPNLINLDLMGTRVEKMDISNIDEELEGLTLSFSRQKSIPEGVYNCKKLLYLHLHDCEINEVSPKMKQLKKLRYLCLTGTTFLSFPNTLFNAPRLDFINDLNVPVDGVYNFEKIRQPKKLRHIIWENINNENFPYAASALKNLRILRFNNSNISKIDDRIGNFDHLETIGFQNCNLPEIPDSFMQLPGISEITLWYNKISSISFEWILFIHKHEIIFNLAENPITDLPAIPGSFQKSEITVSKGSIRFSTGTISAKRLDEYQEIFGTDFIKT